MKKRISPRELRDLYLPDRVLPRKESDVVTLFELMAKDYFGYYKHIIQAKFPDCYAQKGDKWTRIEFEFDSKNFATHGHNPAGCDVIVCWTHGWTETPSTLKVIELRRIFGYGFNVWFKPVAGEYVAISADMDYSDSWSVPSRSSKGDLLLFYRTLPYGGCVVDLFEVDGSIRYTSDVDWRKTRDTMAAIRRVATLDRPLHWDVMSNNPSLIDARFIRGQMRSRYLASDYWDVLSEMIIALNPDLTWMRDEYGMYRFGD
jgi:hypothetical protein